MGNHDRFCVWLLRILGGWLMLAWVAVVLPASWMAAIHEWLGLGVWPTGPLIEYLARSISLLYGYFGLLAIVCSCDLPRYRPLVRLACLCGLPASPILLVIGIQAGMPVAWAVTEGVCALLFCLALWRLLGNETSA